MNGSDRGFRAYNGEISARSPVRTVFPIKLKHLLGRLLYTSREKYELPQYKNLNENDDLTHT